MPQLAPPPATSQDINSRQFRDWFYSIYALIGKPGSTLGTMAYQNYNDVNISGGQLSNVGLSSFSTNLNGYLRGNGSGSIVTASTTIPSTAITGAGAGLSTTITTAKLTPGGSNGSMTFTNGILTAQTQAT